MEIFSNIRSRQKVNKNIIIATLSRKTNNTNYCLMEVVTKADLTDIYYQNDI
jgi:hypothetical protein